MPKIFSSYLQISGIVIILSGFMIIEFYAPEIWNILGEVAANDEILHEPSNGGIL